MGISLEDASRELLRLGKSLPDIAMKVLRDQVAQTKAGIQAKLDQTSIAKDLASYRTAGARGLRSRKRTPIRAYVAAYAQGVEPHLAVKLYGLGALLETGGRTRPHEEPLGGAFGQAHDGGQGALKLADGHLRTHVRHPGSTIHRHDIAQGHIEHQEPVIGRAIDRSVQLSINAGLLR